MRRATRVLLAACLTALAIAAPAAAEPALPEGFQDVVAIEGLQQPTAFRFSPDGHLFVAEKGGTIEVYDGPGDPEPDLFADLRTEVYDHGDRGLLGLAIDPEFDAGRPYVYALYTYDHVLGDPEAPPRWGAPEATGDSCPEPKGADDCLVSGRLVKLTAEESEGELRAEQEGGVPSQDQLIEGWCQQFSSHSVGDLHFGPEGALYASAGEGASFTGADYGQLGEPPNPCGDPPFEGGSLRAQSLQNLDGTIIRIHPDTGDAWPGNPGAGSGNENTRRIVAYGLRNPFRFTADPVTGEIYAGNVGASEIEEIDRFAAPPAEVYNSGWPCYEGVERQFLFKELEELAVCEALYDAEPGSTNDPFFRYNHKQEVVPGDECTFSYGSALGGLAFYGGGQYPAAYDGALFFADSVRGCIYAMFPGEDGRPDPATTTRFMREAQIYPGVDIQEGPDGALYYANLFGDEEYAPGAIHRISYEPGAPTARLTADPTWGPVEPDPLEVHLDAGNSSDPDEGALRFDWDLDGDGSFEAEDAGETRTLALTEADNLTVAVRVTDGEGLSGVARVTVYPGDSPPELTIAEPLPSFTWAVGEEVDFEGHATEWNGAPLWDRSASWSMLLAHCPNPQAPADCHKHPLQSFPEVRWGSFVAPEHDFPSFIEVSFRATDWRGLAATKTVRIDPRTVELALASDPPGVRIAAGLKAEPAPYSLTAIEGSKVVISAPATTTAGGEEYIWQSWSDGGERVHTVDADASTSYEATYASAAPPAPPTPPTPTVVPAPLPLDATPPRTGIRRHPPKRTKKRFARFKFAASERGARFRCKLDRRRFRPCRSPRLYRKLKRGRHAFRVFAIDAAGNRDRSPAIYRWRVLGRRAKARR